jgi:hypothetical protein
VRLGFPQVLVRPLAREGPGAPRLHAFLAPALFSSRDLVLARGLWRMVKAIRRGLPCVPGVVVATLNAGRMRASPH